LSGGSSGRSPHSKNTQEFNHYPVDFSIAIDYLISSKELTNTTRPIRVARLTPANIHSPLVLRIIGFLGNMISFNSAQTLISALVLLVR
jgi:hypothetical protein